MVALLLVLMRAKADNAIFLHVHALSFTAFCEYSLAMSVLVVVLKKDSASPSERNDKNVLLILQ